MLKTNWRQNWTCSIKTRPSWVGGRQFYLARINQKCLFLQIVGNQLTSKVELAQLSLGHQTTQYNFYRGPVCETGQQTKCLFLQIVGNQLTPKFNLLNWVSAIRQLKLTFIGGRCVKLANKQSVCFCKFWKPIDAKVELAQLSLKSQVSV